MTAPDPVSTPGAPSAHLPSFSIDATSPPVEELSRAEWLLAGGLGGFAMGTVAGMPTRRYHALLIGATLPPVGRVLALHSTVDMLRLDPDGCHAHAVALSSFAFRGAPMQPAVRHPDGVLRLIRFENDLTCRWTYRVEPTQHTAGMTVTRELALFERTNACVLRYRVNRDAHGSKPARHARLLVRPLVGLRDMHELTSRWHAGTVESSVTSDGHSVLVRRAEHALAMRAGAARFRNDPQWWEGFFYQIEQDRNQDCFEDVYSPGEFVLELPPDQPEIEADIVASLNPLSEQEPAHLLERVDSTIAARRERLLNLTSAAMKTMSPISPAGETSAIGALVRAADAFVVARAGPPEQRAGLSATDPRALSHVSVIAGYPWFGDWGRDTSISLPGLMLTCGRHQDALRTLAAFAGARKDGVIPNLFDDRTGHAEHNTVDASLWFILGACAYVDRTGDRDGFDRELRPACADAIAWYRRGTLHNIAMDPMDKLLTAGSESTQLTWMDARRDGVVFTPRFGKPVEINALWCAALGAMARTMSGLDPTIAANLADLALAARRSFRTAFWNAKDACLYDRLVPVESPGACAWRPVAEMRPNQIFAVSLPDSPLSAEEQAAVVRRVRDLLLTPMGVRTLAPAEPGYQPRYEGNLFERDRAYHNGTAWPWLLGPYAEAVLRVGNFSTQARLEARAALEPIIRAMSPESCLKHAGCIGQIAEVYDAESPQRPQGCTAQAWSVAETLRVMLLINS